MVDVGKMIAAIRRERGMSQSQLAQKVGTTKQTISNYERGERKPDYVTLEAIADILNVPVSMLISREEQQQALDAIYGQTFGGDDELDEMMQLREDLRRRPEMRTLFSLTRKATPKQVKMLVKMIEAMADGDRDD